MVSRCAKSGVPVRAGNTSRLLVAEEVPNVGPMIGAQATEKHSEILRRIAFARVGNKGSNPCQTALYPEK